MITKFFIAAGFVLALAAAGGSFSIYQSYQSEREQRLEAEAKFMQAQESASAIKADMEQQKSRLIDLEGQIDVLKKEALDFKSQQASKDSEIQSLKQDIAEKSQELAKLGGEIENYKKKDRIPAPVMANPTSASAASDATTSFSKPVVTPSTTTSNTSNTVAAANAPVASTPAVIPAEAPATDDSHILTVNRKFNFIVVNLGLRDGLRMGDKIQVMQNGTQKALAQIEKIYDKFSAATLLDEDKGNPVHEGDSVRKG